MVMSFNEIILGDSFELIKQVPAKSIDCVVTSPPYWQLRDYGFSEQLGLEKTYNEYLEKLWDLFDNIKIALKDEGTVFVNLGDTYGTTSGNILQGNLGTNKIKYTGAITGYNKPESMDKCLLLIPHRFAIGMIERGWILRNTIIWAKPNGMPESVTDRFSKKHEYIFFFVKSKKYYFDLDSIRDKGVGSHQMFAKNSKSKYKNEKAQIAGTYDNRNIMGMNPNGKNPGDVADFWKIPTQSSNSNHYATFNTKLISKPIIAGCPEGGVILDPFAGTGTTLFRAYELNRKFLGFEGSQEYYNDMIKNWNIIKSQGKLF
jgi:DNA modification methylase